MSSVGPLTGYKMWLYRLIYLSPSWCCTQVSRDRCIWSSDPVHFYISAKVCKASINVKTVCQPSPWFPLLRGGLSKAQWNVHPNWPVIQAKLCHVKAFFYTFLYMFLNDFVCLNVCLVGCLFVKYGNVCGLFKNVCFEWKCHFICCCCTFLLSLPVLKDNVK